MLTITRFVYCTFFADSVDDPAAVMKRIGSWGEDHEMLHISPRQARISFQGKGANSGRNGSRSWGACMFRCAQEFRSQGTVHVYRGDGSIDIWPARTVRRRQSGRAFLQVPRLEPNLFNGHKTDSWKKKSS